MLGHSYNRVVSKKRFVMLCSEKDAVASPIKSVCTVGQRDGEAEALGGTASRPGIWLPTSPLPEVARPFVRAHSRVSVRTGGRVSGETRLMLRLDCAREIDFVHMHPPDRTAGQDTERSRN